MLTLPNPTAPERAAEDARLAAAAVGGDRQALNALIERHADFAYNVALRMLARVPDARDAMGQGPRCRVWRRP